MKTMLNQQAKQLLISRKEAQKKLSKLSVAEKKKLEKSWDVEHAYYSSALEGSNIDRKEFDKLAKAIL